MAERITREQVAKVAGLANLRLTDDELDVFTRQLGDILDHARDVGSLQLDDVEPTAHPVGLVNVLRPDVVVPGIDREEVLGAAPAVEDGRFKVPAILGDEP